MLIFLYISLEKRQNSTRNITNFRAELHANGVGKLDKKFIWWTVYPKSRFNTFSGYVFSWDFWWGKPATHLKYIMFPWSSLVDFNAKTHCLFCVSALYTLLSRDKSLREQYACQKTHSRELKGYMIIITFFRFSLGFLYKIKHLLNYNIRNLKQITILAL